MNYGEIKREIMSLADLDENDMTDFGERVPSSINRAITEIGLQRGALYGTYEFDVDEGETDYLYIDMAKQKGFLDFADTPVMIEKEGAETYQAFTNYDIQMGTILVINPEDNAGSYRVFYKKDHKKFTLESEDTEEIELRLILQNLIAPLAAYYLLLPEDAAIATQIYNKSLETADATTPASNKPKVEIKGGWDI